MSNSTYNIVNIVFCNIMILYSNIIPYDVTFYCSYLETSYSCAIIFLGSCILCQHIYSVARLGLSCAIVICPIVEVLGIYQNEATPPR